jgi:hypothetical protein
MIKEYLLSVKNNKVSISLYTDKEDTSKFSFGFVQGISDDWVLLASISPFGFYDGFIIKRYEDVYRCECNDKYGEKIRKLYQLRRQKHSIVDLSSNSLIIDLVQHAQKNRLVVSVEIHYSECDDVQGFVADIQDGFLRIEQLDEYGNPDGVSTISFEDITCIVCDSDNEMSIKLLAENH